MIFLYNIFLTLYTLAIRIAALFNPKAALWINGRKGLLEKIISAFPEGKKRIWMHCASLGEFEQGRPVLDALRHEYPDHQIVLTFFSPSGYEIRKNYEGADYVFYLPMDGARNARLFIKAVNPSLVIFVKYEFWYYYLRALKQHHIPALLIAAAFRKDQIFFKNHGGFFRKILGFFTEILVQDLESKRLLEGIGFTQNVCIGGDTRYDRVTQIAAAARIIPEIEQFKGAHKLLIGGSTWPLDEQVLKAILPKLPQDWKMILAPHEINEAHIQAVKNLFGEEMILFSQWKKTPDAKNRVLTIDNIGMLSSLYRYGEVAFVGGGFNKGGIHNVLEPAVFGLPVMIGPVYKKFVEAVDLVDHGFIFPVANDKAALNTMNKLLEDDFRLGLKHGLAQLMQANVGATEKIRTLIAAKDWL